MESRRDDESDKKPVEGSYSNQLEELMVSVNDLQTIINPSYDPTEDTDPAKAAERTGPRVYTLKNHHNRDVRFFVFGCQGDKHVIPQKQVADLLKKTIKEHPEQKPDFIILLGDNFYPNGVDSPSDDRFTTQFYNMYDIPCFVVLGNHDFNYSKEDKIKKGLWASSTPTGKVRAMHQVAHSYLLHEGDPKLTFAKTELYRQNEIDFASLPKWNIPWYHYSVVIGNLQLFFLDSNSFADDYLTYHESIAPLTSRQNQAAWLREEFKKCEAAKRTPLLFQHHPLVTCGSRNRYGEGDASLYLKDDRWKRLAKLFELNANDYQYNQLISRIFEKMNIKFAANFGAHDHSLYNFISPDIHQYIVGSGGGKLQDRACFDKHQNIGFYLKELGFVSFACNKTNPKIMNLDVFTVNGSRLTLTNTTSRPVTIMRNSDTADLYHLVLQACALHAAELAQAIAKADKANKPNIENYTYALAKTFNYKNEPTLFDVDGMHRIIAYFCQPSLDDFFTTSMRLRELMDALTVKTTDSLYGKLNHALKNSRFGKTIDEILDVNEAEPKLSTSTI